MKSSIRKSTVVSGLQWGDEGKGKIVDLQAPFHDVIVRFNGGANAGHTVVVGEDRFPLHLVPCGILRPDKTAVIANGVVLDPEVLALEIDSLRESGIEVGSNLRISDRAHLIMPYHKIADGLMKKAIAASMGEEKEIGTTGRGIGPCYSDKATRSTAIRCGELADLGALGAKLEHIARVKNATLGALADLAGVPFEVLDVGELRQYCKTHAEKLAPHVCDTSALLHERLRQGARLLFEGANGFLLDVDHGTYPFVTSSNSSALGVYAGTGVPPYSSIEVCGVVKAYTSRVGAGPFPTEQENEIGERIRRRGKEFGTTTGRPRRCGWLDLVAVRYAASRCGVDYLAVTLLDVLAGFDELQICVCYEIDGTELHSFPAGLETLERAAPVYETLPGFAEDVSECTERGDLPAGAENYLAAIEDIAELPVRLVSVGPERSQTIVTTVD